MAATQQNTATVAELMAELAELDDPQDPRGQPEARRRPRG